MNGPPLLKVVVQKNGRKLKFTRYPGFNYHKVVVKVSLSLSFFSTGVFAEMTAYLSEFSDLSLDQYTETFHNHFTCHYCKR